MNRKTLHQFHYHSYLLVFIGSVVESGVDKVVVFPTPPGCSIGTLVTGRIRDSFRVAALQRCTLALQKYW